MRIPRIRYVSLAAAIVGATLLLGATAAAQRPPVISTKLLLGVPFGAINGPDEFVLSAGGPLMSSKSKCEASRTVKLYFKSDGTRTLVDVDTSSRNGQWGVSGTARSQPDAFIVKVTRKRIKVHHHARICGADRVVHPLAVLTPTG
jgi:hypothetical protein